MSDKKINRRPQVRNAWDGKWIVVDSNEQSVKGIYLDCLCVDGKWRPGPIEQRHIFRTEADAHLAMASWMKGEVPISERDAHLAALRTAAGEFFSSVMKPHPNWPTANSVFDALCDERREGKDASVREWATKNILRIEAAVSVLNPLLPDHAKQPATKSEGWSAYDDLESELKTVTSQRDAAVERLKEVLDSDAHGNRIPARQRARDFLHLFLDKPTLPATESGGGDRTVERECGDHEWTECKTCGGLVGGWHPNVRSTKRCECAPAGDSPKAGDGGERTMGVDPAAGESMSACTVTMPCEDFNEQQKELAALRSRLDAAGVVVGGLQDAGELARRFLENSGLGANHVRPTLVSALTAAREWQEGGKG